MRPWFSRHFSRLPFAVRRSPFAVSTISTLVEWSTSVWWKNRLLYFENSCKKTVHVWFRVVSTGARVTTFWKYTVRGIENEFVLLQLFRVRTPSIDTFPPKLKDLFIGTWTLKSFHRKVTTKKFRRTSVNLRMFLCLSSCSKPRCQRNTKISSFPSSCMFIKDDAFWHIVIGIILGKPLRRPAKHCLWINYANK